jgi:hypothetical protein
MSFLAQHKIVEGGEGAAAKESTRTVGAPAAAASLRRLKYITPDLSPSPGGRQRTQRTQTHTRIKSEVS